MRAFETEKTDVAEVDRSIYDIKNAANAAFEVNSGLTPDIVAKISEEKHDPEWMREFRQKSLEIYNKMPVQNWGPSIEGLDMHNIVTSGVGIWGPNMRTATNSEICAITVHFSPQFAS